MKTAACRARTNNLGDTIPVSDGGRPSSGAPPVALHHVKHLEITEKRPPGSSFSGEWDTTRVLKRVGRKT
jgi:hypothetical protein